MILFVWFGFIATFNNISVILRRSVLLVEEVGVPEDNHWPGAGNWQPYHMWCELNLTCFCTCCMVQSQTRTCAIHCIFDRLQWSEWLIVGYFTSSGIYCLQNVGFRQSIQEKDKMNFTILNTFTCRINIKFWCVQENIQKIYLH